jgi:uncharacterized coiled-coil DUF342 family protein
MQLPWPNRGEQSIEELEKRLDSANHEKHSQIMDLQAQLNESKEHAFDIQNKLTASVHDALSHKTRADVLEVGLFYQYCPGGFHK